MFNDRRIIIGCVAAIGLVVAAVAYERLANCPREFIGTLRGGFASVPEDRVSCWQLAMTTGNYELDLSGIGDYRTAATRAENRRVVVTGVLREWTGPCGVRHRRILVSNLGVLP